ncbi:atrial natriuretic peptide receptor 2-like [Paramacrobiotus metropolitanus]|uniref:atrial natriuretic peptide receptor 2-like n=1 Tax=Paramacrobiotus metropolitanus TaxID=2943436 RepID=UPI0024455FAA|nr:atrial natriuretic peptide receptor 2-like [Paramacrobiotus metropolitanus]
MQQLALLCLPIFSTLSIFSHGAAGPYPDVLNVSLLIVASMNSQEIFSLYYLRPIIELARGDALTLHGVNLTVAYSGATPTDTCDLVQASVLIANFSRTLRRNQPDLVVGPFCDADMRVIAQLAMGNNVTTFTAGTPYWDMFGLSNGLNRIAYSAKDLFQPIIRFCLMNQWTNLSVIWYQMDPVNTLDGRNYTYELLLRALDTAITAKSPNSSVAKIRMEEIVHNMADPKSTNASENLYRASLKSRMIIFLLPTNLLRGYLIQSSQLGFMSGEYVFFATDEFVDNIIFNVNRSKGTDGFDGIVQQGYQHLFVASVHNYQNDTSHRKFVQKMMQATDEAGVTNYTSREAIYIMANHYDVLMIIAGAYRAAHQLGYVFNRTNAWDSVFSRQYLNKTLLQKDYGLSCDALSISAAGDKKEKYDLWYMNSTTGQFVMAAIYDSLKRKFNLTLDIGWENGTVPPSYPSCGYTGTECDPEGSDNRLMDAILIQIPVLFVFVVSGVYITRRYRRHIRNKTDWIADPDDLTVMNPNDEHSTRRSRLSRAIHAAKEELEGKRLEQGGSGVFEAQSFVSAVSASAGHTHWNRRSNANPDTGVWKKTMVTVRWCNKKSVTLSRRVTREVQQVRSLKNDNLAVFIGACMAKDRVLIIYEYCSRGSLQELIERKDDKFEWAMRIAFLEDILNALLYLQKTAVGCHSRLTSQCCHIERRFSIRLSDYGLPSFFDHNTLESWIAKRNPKYSEAQLWQAPEQLQAEIDQNDQFKKGVALDVYSFGIILQEVLLRSAPYSMYPDLDTDTLTRYLRIKRPVDNKLVRPFFPPDESAHIDAGLMHLAEACWSENPDARPNLHTARETVKEAAARMGIENRGSIMDMLLVQMDQQNSRLQAVVENKCSHILKETQKSDRIIALCFENTLAEKLKTSQTISPEAFEIVTVLMMQMNHFEHIVVDSTPAQLIDILNEYSRFIDDTVQYFDCRKMDMDVDLITKLQMGIHSGPCVAAVIGRKIPRYTITGDTLDISKRMLTTGFPQRIQISCYTKDVLETFGSFKTEERGEVFVKGKGALTTYWLAGEDGNKELKLLQNKYEAILLAEDDKLIEAYQTVHPGKD